METTAHIGSIMQWPSLFSTTNATVCIATGLEKIQQYLSIDMNEWCLDYGVQGETVCMATAASQNDEV